MESIFIGNYAVVTFQKCQKSLLKETNAQWTVANLVFMTEEIKS